MHFGYGPIDEYNKIKGIIRETHLHSSNERVRLSMELVKSVAIEAKRIGSNEIKKIDGLTRKNKTVGAIIPTDITIAYEVLKQALEIAASGIELGMFCYIVYNRIREKFKKTPQNSTTNLMQNEILKVIKKMTKDSKASTIILEQYQKVSFAVNRKTIVRINKKKGFTINSRQGKKKSSRRRQD